MVIDVLRWSTVVVTALAQGADWVEAVASPASASDRALQLGRERIVLGGERDNVALPGFDLGNSPLEYTAVRLRGRGLVTTTTNGTQAVIAASEAREVLIGAFVNIDALVDLLKQRPDPVTLLCSGQAGAEAAEDTACAGAIAAALRDAGQDPGTARALGAWEAVGRDPLRALTLAPHGAALEAAGFGADVAFAAVPARFGLVPTREPVADRQPPRFAVRFPNADRIVSDMHPRPPETDAAEAAPGRPAPP